MPAHFKEISANVSHFYQIFRTPSISPLMYVCIIYMNKLTRTCFQNDAVLPLPMSTRDESQISLIKTRTTVVKLLKQKLLSTKNILYTCYVLYKVFGFLNLQKY